MPPPFVRTLLIVACLFNTATVGGSEDSSPPIDWRPSLATLWGGSGDQEFRAAAATDDGIVLFGGDAGSGEWPALRHYQIGRGAGLLVRYDTLLGKTLSTTTFPSSISALAIDLDGNVFVAAGQLYKLDAGCGEVLWQGGPGGRRICPDGEGGAWVLAGKQAVRVGEGGTVLGTLKGGKDIAVDPYGKRVFTCGFHCGRGGGNPVHIPNVKAWSYSGEKLWHMWEYSGEQLNSVGDMADSHPKRLYFGPDKKLYMFGDSDGGNTAYRHHPYNLGEPLKAELGGTPFTQMWLAFRSNRMLFACRIDPATGNMERGSFFYGTLHNEEKDRKEIGDAQAKGIYVDGDGRIYLTGLMNCNIPWTDDAVHQEAAPIDRSGYWNNPASTEEMYLAVFGPDFRSLEYCTGLNQGSSSEFSSVGKAISGGGKGVVVVGSMKTPPSGSSDAASTAYLHKPVQDGYGGDKDAYVAIFSAGQPPAETRELMQTTITRLFPNGDPVLLERIAKADSFTALISELAAGDAEEEQMAEALTEIGHGLLASARDNERETPVTTLACYCSLADKWQSTPVGQQAGERIAALKADTEWQTLLEIDQLRTSVLQLEQELEMPERANEAAWYDRQYYRTNRRVLNEMQDAAEELQQDHPDAAHTAEALAACNRYCIPVGRRGAKLLEALELAFDAAKRLRAPRKGEPVYDNKDFYASNREPLDTIQSIAKAMHKEAPQSGFTRRVVKLAERLAIPLEK
ncbi:MAG: YncE family protein [Planctomycetota bacterium]